MDSLITRVGGQRLRIAGAAVLVSGGMEAIESEVTVADGTIVGIGAAGVLGERQIDGRGLLLLPGIVDLHGDAFERQIMPRPGVFFPPRLALLETDRQLAANGITTAFHGLTCTWEPGLRSTSAARLFLSELRAIRPLLAVDTRLHLRHETFHLDGEEAVLAWLAEGLVDLLAFNDHTDWIRGYLGTPAAGGKFIDRSGLTEPAFRILFEQVTARAAAVPGSIARLAAAARRHGLPIASHDDVSPEVRAWFDALGSRISEFPLDLPTAQAAVATGAAAVFGAPNILRGGSHCGRACAATAIAAGACTVLTSDYYYPSLLQAVFMLAAQNRASVGRYWPLVSANPAAAAGLADRGRITPGARADLILVEQTPAGPTVAATWAAGRLVYAARFL